MNRLVPVLLTLGILLAACGETQPAPLATATPDAYQLEMINIQAQATMAAVQCTASAMQANMTGTAYAPTQQAASTATERAWVQTGWTATAAIEQTATSAGGTATQKASEATSTQRAVDITATADIAVASAHATAMYGEAVSVELAVERERMMNKVQAVAPWGALLIGFVFFLVMAYRWSKVRPVSRDARGDAPLMVIDGRVYDADRNPYPVADFSGKKPSIPVLTPPELQSPTTARDQMIDLATRGSQGQANPQRRAIAQKMVAQNILPQPASVRVLPPEQARPLLGDVIPGIVQDAIETDLNAKDER